MKELQIGDIVRVREWDDMAEEYGYLTPSKDVVNVPFHFTQFMRMYSNNIYQIYDKTYDEDYDANRYTLTDAPGICYHTSRSYYEVRDWSFSEEMLALVQRPAEAKEKKLQEIKKILYPEEKFDEGVL